MNLIKPSFSTGYAKNASESANPNLWKGLVGAWMPMMNQGGWNLQDISGRSNDAELYGRTTPVQLSTIGGIKLVTLDGSVDYYRVNKVQDFSPKLLTYCYYVTQPTLGGTYSPGGVWRSGKRAWFSQHDNGYPRFYVSYNGINSLFLQSSVRIQSNKPTFIAMRYDGSTIKIFQDGVETDSLNYSSGLFNSQTEFCIGDILFAGPSSPFGWNWRGGIASQTIYNRALSPTEIKQLYLNPAAPFLRKQQTVGISTAAVVPSANFNPFSVLTHPLEQ